MGATQSKSRRCQPAVQQPAGLIKQLARSKSPSRSQPAVSSPAPFLTDRANAEVRPERKQPPPTTKNTISSISTLRWADFIQQEKSVEETEQALPDSPDFFTPVYAPSTFSSQSSTSNSSALFSVDSQTPSSLSSASTDSKRKASPIACTAPSLLSDATQHSLGHPVVGYNVKSSVYEDPGCLSEMDPLQQAEMAQRMIQGIGMPADVDQGFADLLQLAKKAPCAEILYSLGVCYYNGFVANRQPDHTKAYHTFEQAVNEASEQHHALIAQVQYRMAKMLLKGEGVPTNKAKAFQYFKLAAQKDHSRAQYMVGRFYEHLRQDWDQARYWYTRAAEHGQLAEAQASLGSLLLDHLDTFADAGAAPLSCSELVLCAIKVLLLAADQSNGIALLRLASVYAKGDLVVQDVPLSLAYYERAARVIADPDHYRRVHYNIGLTYYNGDAGITQDYQKAIEHFDHAQQSGYAPAQRTLGHMYHHGLGVAKDQALAHMLFQKAADQGDVAAMDALGSQYEHGHGCKADRVRALDMYRAAADAGSMEGEYALATLLHADRDYTNAYRHFQRVIESEICPDTPADATLIRTKAKIMICLYRLNGWGAVTKDPAAAFEDLVCQSDSTLETVADAHYWVGKSYKEGVRHATTDTFVVKPNKTRALHYFERGAKLGDTSSQVEAAGLLSHGTLTSTSSDNGDLIKDTARAFAWYKAAAEQDHSLALHCLGLYYAKAIQPVLTANPDQAITLFKKAASLGYAPSMLCLAQQLLSRNNYHNIDKNQIKENHKEAYAWLIKASLLRDPNPTVFRHLATVYEAGIGVEDESDPTTRYTKARHYLQKALDMGDAQAWCHLARHYENGWSVKADFEKALLCMDKARQKGYAKACLAKAELYERRYMWSEALYEYNQMAQEYPLQSSVGWTARLAKCRHVATRGHGEESDRYEVAAWLHAMVEQPASEALIEPCTLLGVCYEKGIGLPQDKERAMHWHEAAIHQTTHGLHWPQASARVRLVKLYAPWRPAAAYQQCQMLRPLLDHMNRQSPELALQARQVRYFLGYLTLHGLGVAQNEKEARQWLIQAADEGDGLAAYELGMLADRQGDEKECRRRLEQGVCANDVGSMRELALLLQRDHRDDIMWDGEDAYQHLKHAALDLGDLEALVQLGLAHEHGLGTTTPAGNPARALIYYRAAADRGHRKAILYAGEACHRLGLYDEAMAWFEKDTTHATSRIRLVLYQLWQHDDSETDATRNSLRQLESMVHALIAEDQHSETKDVEEEKRLRRSTIGEVCYEVGICYEKRTGIAENGAAKMWHRRAMDQAEHVEAMVRLGALLVQEADYDSAFEIYERAAACKHSEALYMVGLYHWQQMGSMDRKPAVAKKYFEKAAQQGHAKATFTLGHILWHEQAQYCEGFALYKRAADLEMDEACREIGNMYHEGVDSGSGFVVRRDHRRAYEYYLRGARLGDSMAALMVGSYYEKGYGGAQRIDHAEALAWYAEAARMGCGPLAELAMGVVLHGQDRFDDAFEHFVCASKGEIDSDHDSVTADDGLAHAKVMVALYHLHGWGSVQRDATLGFQLLREIADNGTSEAFAEVARCYEDGVGVESNLVDALAYWELAAAMDDLEAIERVGDYHRDGLAGRPADFIKAATYYDRAAQLRHNNAEQEYSIHSIRSSTVSSLDTYATPGSE